MLSPTEIRKLESYLRQKFGNKALTLKARKEDKDSVEVLLGDEFIGTIYRDDDEGDISYNFNMAILEMDLPKAAVG